MLKNLVNSNEIPQYNLDELVIGLTIGSISAKLYSFAKLHKPEILIRPIILVTQARKILERTIRISIDLLLSVINEYFKSDYVISNLSFKDTLLSSFDAKKLFTYVHLDEIIKIGIDMYYSNLSRIYAHCIHSKSS